MPCFSGGAVCPPPSLGRAAISHPPLGAGASLRKAPPAQREEEGGREEGGREVCLSIWVLLPSSSLLCVVLVSSASFGWGLPFPLVAGRRLELFYAHIGCQAFVRAPNGLSVGFQLLQDIAGHITRDHLLLLPRTDFNDVRNGPVLYRDSLFMSCSMLKELVLGSSESESGASLAADAVSFWSEHGDRAQMAS